MFNLTRLRQNFYPRVKKSGVARPACVKINYCSFLCVSVCLILHVVVAVEDIEASKDNQTKDKEIISTKSTPSAGGGGTTLAPAPPTTALTTPTLPPTTPTTPRLTTTRPTQPPLPTLTQDLVQAQPHNGTALDLCNRNISQIEDKAFEWQGTLTLLWLDANSLKEVKLSYWVGLESLRELDLGCNR